MAIVYVGLGSNLGEKEDNIRRAVNLLQERVGEVISLSAFYDTEPEGFISNHLFVNAVCALKTNLPPLALLEETEKIEQLLGRESKSVNGDYKDRVIDIDLLLYDNLIISTDRLTIPHPYMTERRFVIEPLMEIAPELVFPSTNNSIREIYNLLKK